MLTEILFGWSVGPVLVRTGVGLAAGLICRHRNKKIKAYWEAVDNAKLSTIESLRDNWNLYKFMTIQELWSRTSFYVKNEHLFQALEELKEEGKIYYSGKIDWRNTYTWQTKVSLNLDHPDNATWYAQKQDTLNAISLAAAIRKLKGERATFTITEVLSTPALKDRYTSAELRRICDRGVLAYLFDEDGMGNYKLKR